MKAKLMIVLLVVVLASCSRDPIRYELASLFNDNETSGSFFLGSGYIGGEEYLYAWGRESPSAPFQRIRAHAKCVKVYADSDENPYCLVDWVRYPCRVVFHVPVNTIIRKFELK